MRITLTAEEPEVPDNSNLACLLDATAARTPTATAVILDDQHLTYAELADASRQLSVYLHRQGVIPGDRVAIMLPNVLAFPVVFFAALKSGAVVVPMNPLFKAREIEYYLQDSGAVQYWSISSDEATRAAESAGVPLKTIGPNGLAPYLNGEGGGGGAGGDDGADVVGSETASRAEEDLAAIVYTSGTTGRPKGAQLTHRNLATNLATANDTLLHLGSQDVVMGCLPLFHIFGLTVGMLTSVFSGATLTLIPRFDPAKALSVIERDRVTVFLGVPTMYGALLAASAESPADLSSLRLAIAGGSSMPVEVMRKFEETFGCVILEGYGLSETSPVACFNHPDRERKPGSIGTPVRGVELKLVGQDGHDVPENDAETIGELWIRGENVMQGYWGRPEATAEAIVEGGWFRSGDLARRDAEGFYYIVDRTKDMILRGGMNVYPREIEEVLYEHPAVAEAAVVGVPHPGLGQEVAAFVVLARGASATEAELVEHVKSQVAPYKYPRHLTLIDALPKGATGKILKRELISTD